MTRRVTVRTADRRLAASFAAEGNGEPTVDCAGTLRELGAGRAADLLLGGVAAACARAGRTPPRGLQVRATSSIPAGDVALVVAATVAGAAAANAMLGLGLDDAGVASVSEAAARRAVGAGKGIAVTADTVGEYRVTVRESCPD